MKFNFSEVLVAAGIQQRYLSMCWSNRYVPCFVVSYNTCQTLHCIYFSAKVSGYP